MTEHHHAHVHMGEVVLDIGGDMGGLIVHTDADLRGEEIEVSPSTDPTRLTHTDVQERVFQGRTVYTAVFTPLPAGEYQVARPLERTGERIRIEGGRVTEIDWRRAQSD
ncbi:MAG: phospholipase [Chloroflexi bacterium]|nr:phospholipase [Chloroflexota bacterium]MBV9543486.1 phospholipase [Chloroflexota bacterium]